MRRFKEFENAEAWEQRRLKNLGETFTGLSGKTKNDFGHGDAKFVTYVNVFSNPIADSNGTDIVEIDNRQNQVKFGDMLFTTSSETPEEVGMSSVWLENTENVYLNSFCFGYRPRVKLDPYYAAFMFRSPKVRKNFILLAQGISRYNISKNKVMEMSVPVPNMNEQKKVGEFFTTLDTTITFHQRKLEKVKALKTAYLAEMFPAEGERKPKRRFAGFTDAWEQCRFKDVLDSVDGIRRGPFGSSLKKEVFVSESDYVVYEQHNAIYDKYETRYNITQEKFNELYRFKVSAGDFIMSGAGTIGRISRVPRGIKQGVFNQALIRMKTNSEITDSEFFLQWMRSDDMQRKLTEANPASAMVNLVPMSEVKDWGVTVPCKTEQIAIGTFFRTLDTAITFHQRKLEKLQNIKSAYLNEMFV